jgi:hypothetical protein
MRYYFIPGHSIAYRDIPVLIPQIQIIGSDPVLFHEVRFRSGITATAPLMPVKIIAGDLNTC